MKLLFILLLTGSSQMHLLAQKRPLDFAAFDTWPSIEGATLSNNGRYVAFMVTSRTGGTSAVVQDVIGDWRKEISNARNIAITEDNRFFIYLKGVDSLCVLEIGKDRLAIIPHVRSFMKPGDGVTRWIAYQRSDKRDILYLRDLVTEKEFYFDSVIEYAFNENGKYLALQAENDSSSDTSYSVAVVDIMGGGRKVVWAGRSKASHITFDNSGTQIAFVTEEEQRGPGRRELRYYDSGMDTAIETSEMLPAPGPGEFMVSNDPELRFSGDGSKLFFRIAPSAPKDRLNKSPLKAKVDIWNYKDEFLQSEQLVATRGADTAEYLAVMNRVDRKVTRLLDERKYFALWPPNGGSDFLVAEARVNTVESWRPSARTSFYLVDTKDGSKETIANRIIDDQESGFSGTGRYFVWYDMQQRSYFCYNVLTKTVRNVTSGIHTPVFDEIYPSDSFFPPYGIAGWIAKDAEVLIYDRYDIWMVDPDGVEKPIDLTHGYGRRTRTVFRLLGHDPEVLDSMFLKRTKGIVLAAFNEKNKFNGFYGEGKLQTDSIRELITGPFVYYFPFISNTSGTYLSTLILKAKEADRYLLQKMSASDFPNLCITDNFCSFKILTNLEPQKHYNWMTAEIERYSLIDGGNGEGILYKPENFDPKKRYPVIFLIYKQFSAGVNKYLTPDYCTGEINIPYFVSNGYLVFEPDMYYQVGHPGESIFNSVVSAVKHLTTFPWIDPSKIGLDGFSTGGYEANELITRTHLFAAAATGAGYTDLISSFGSVKPELFYSNQKTIETEYWVGTTPWEDLNRYIENSPVIAADKVTTPLLILHNRNDNRVPWAQGIEFFTALRRLGKKVWMLQYDGEGHGLVTNELDEIDYTKRITQFFDYYLRNAPPPVWMTRGVGASWKGIDDGLELDMSGAKP